MTDVVRLASAVSPGVGDHHRVQTARIGRRHPTFHHVLAAAMTGARPLQSTGAIGSDIRTAAVQVPLPMAHPGWVEKPAATLPARADAALSQAMALEDVPQSWQSGLRFIMTQESGGQVNAKNPVHSARGLFQLTAANYHLNPNGAGSFGNAVEEAQGGIRYIQQRYGSADNAVAFWRQHHWY
jgi:hypothetical protein